MDNKGITILHWNARSVCDKFEEVVHIVSSSDAECCIFSESWLTRNTLDGAIMLDGYLLYQLDWDPTMGEGRGGCRLVIF